MKNGEDVDGFRARREAYESLTGQNGPESRHTTQAKNACAQLPLACAGLSARGLEGCVEAQTDSATG